MEERREIALQCYKKQDWLLLIVYEVYFKRVEYCSTFISVSFSFNWRGAEVGHDI